MNLFSSHGFHHMNTYFQLFESVPISVYPWLTFCLVLWLRLPRAVTCTFQLRFFA